MRKTPPGRTMSGHTRALQRLRALVPEQPVTSYLSALTIAKQQAAIVHTWHLPARQLFPISEMVFTTLPRIRLERVTQHLPVVSTWDTHKKQWVIQLSRSLSTAERRIAIAREVKRICDFGFIETLYTSTNQASWRVQAERAADYFAACYYVPAHLLAHAWETGIRLPIELAQLFDVTEDAIVLRLRAVGLLKNDHNQPPNTDLRESPKGAQYEHNH